MVSRMDRGFEDRGGCVSSSARGLELTTEGLRMYS